MYADFRSDDLLLSNTTNFKSELLEKRDGKLPDPAPRKGIFKLVNSVLNKKQQKMFTLSQATLGRLANTDPITWAIRRTIKSYISQVKWDIVPDVDDVEADLDRYEEIALANVSQYETTEKFISDILDADLVKDIEKNLKRIYSGPDADKRPAIRWYFQSVLRRLKQEAETHRHVVKKLFESPNSTDKTFRVLQEKIIDDILIYDAGVMVKNWSATNKLAELYTFPGQQVKIYRNEDGTAPEPPEPAYVWEDMGVNRAEFSNNELIYLMENPQQNGYGTSPLEVAAYIITASLFADEYQIDYFKHSNVPPGVFDLGKDVDSDQLSSFRSQWENEVQGRGGQHRMVFISGSDSPQFIPMATRTNKDMQLLEYLKWTMGVKCACYGLSPQDSGWTDQTTGMGGGGVAKQQHKISQARGIQSILSLLAEHYNREIVKTEFAFTDVKFEWSDIDISDPEEESRVDMADLSSGVISINERRRKLGLKSIDGGDAYLITSAPSPIMVRDLEPSEKDSSTPESDVDGAQPASTDKPTMTQQLTGNPTEQPTTQNQKPEASEPQTPEITEKDQTGGGSLSTMNHGRMTGTSPALDEEEAENKKAVKVVVNRRIPANRQKKMLDETVEHLKKDGIDVTLNIGFKNEKE